MDNGIWVWPEDWTEEDIRQWRAENAVKDNAIQWTGDNWAEVEAFASDASVPKSYDVQVWRHSSGFTEVFDYRYSRWIEFKRFDWIIRGPQGECYLVDEDNDE